MTIRIIAEVTYDFYSNTIRRDKNIQVVTEENKDSYYCKAIGTPFKKIKEGEVQCVSGGVVPYLSVFKTANVVDDYYDKETGKVKQFIIDNLNAELVEIIKEELKNRIEKVKEI